MKVKSDISVFKFKYNGKELDAMHGLNEYDYHARQMDPIIGQFNFFSRKMKIVAEKFGSLFFLFRLEILLCFHIM